MTRPDALSLDQTPLTLGVISYNQEEYIEEAVRGALAQTHSPLQIVVSDDASTDDTFAIIQRTVRGYDGPHQLTINRNETNLGLAGNVNRVMDLATGEIVLLAGGDDISMPDRASRSAAVLKDEPHCMCLSFGTIQFEDTNVPVDFGDRPDPVLTRYARNQYFTHPSFHLNGASRAFRRRAFDAFGPIALDCPTEDSVMLLRCLLLGEALESPEQQVLYRVHGGNLYASDRKYQIDYHAIHRQYVSDINVASTNNWIDETTRTALTHALERRLAGIVRMNLRHRFRESPNRLRFYLRSVLRSDSFTSREKLRLLASSLKHRKGVTRA